ncbi:DUF6159 family protein [Halopiger djelfimassiliensis]|uniref:DUF6159 family protein n=1 Tax=Halopiger djelfimassiliensis TaxID=1293047 RepID=UPI000677C816|nr:DUF6159 family protein [Halopiger djelfimassiliensis]
MFERLQQGVQVIDASLDVFRARPRLAVLPLLSLLTVGSAYTAIGVALLHYELVGAIITNNVVQYGVVFVAFGISSGLGIFFNAAVVHCARQYFEGAEPSVRGGLAAAWAARRSIAKWGLVSATVGTVLYIAEDAVPGVGTLTRSVLDMAWGLLTFFVIPVIVIERNPTLRSDLRSSGTAFKRTWGESVTASLGIGLALLPAGLVGLGLLAVAYVSAGGIVAYALGALGGLVLVGTLVTSHVLGMVARTALYHYATEGEHVGPVAELDPDGVFAES